MSSTKSRPLVELVTESFDHELLMLDTMSVAQIANEMNRLDHQVPAAVHAVLPEISLAIEAVSERFNNGGRIIYVGAGTSGRIGILDASEAMPTFGLEPGKVIGAIAGGPEAVTEPTEGAEDDANAGAEQVDALEVSSTDVVIGLASSGRTPFVIGAVKRAKSLGALTVGVSCNSPSELSAEVDFPIEVVVGPELIGGSTRLKAGTTQKLILNMFSTIVMIKAGKTYGNLMVDVRPTNQKLRRRAVNIVCSVTGVSEEEAQTALERADFEAKTAILMVQGNLNPDEARTKLQAVSGRLRDALEE